MSLLIASCLSSLITRVLTHPIDTVKSRMQCGSGTSLVETTRLIVRMEGLLALYKGLPITLVFSLPGLSVYLCSYDLCSALLSEWTQLPVSGFVVSTLSATIAETLSGLFWTPMEIIKTRQQISMIYAPGSALDSEEASVNESETNTETNTETDVPYSREYYEHVQYHTAWEHIRSIYTDEGFSGFFQGYWLGLAVYVPYSIVYFIIYEKLKLLTEYDNSYIVLISAIASLIAALVSNVVDVIKTRWQAQTHVRNEKTTVYQVVRLMIAEEGWAVFMAGASARCAWAVPSAIISFTAYENFKALLI